MYSGAVAQLAAAEGVPLIPARQSFLCERSCAQMIAADGIHLTMEGYHRLYDTLAQWMKKNL